MCETIKYKRKRWYCTLNNIINRILKKTFEVWKWMINEVFENVVVIGFQNTFHSKIYQNNIFSTF
jgi:hypothetical protein